MNSRAFLIIIIAFCLFVLALFVRLLLANRRKDRIEYDAVALPQEPNKNDPDEKINELVDRGKKEEAINLAREEKNMSRDDAEDYVESFEQGISFLSTDEESSLTADELENKVFELLLQNKKPDAISLVSENKLIGLEESREFVESVEKKHNLS